MSSSTKSATLPLNTATPAPRRYDTILSLLVGAAVAFGLLRWLGFGATEIWSSFSSKNIGGSIFKGLAFSGLAGGLAATIFMKGLPRADDRVLPPAAAALCWGIIGLLTHINGTRYLDTLPPTLHPQAEVIFWMNGPNHAFSVALGLLMAAIIGWTAERRFFAPQRADQATRRKHRKKPKAVPATTPNEPEPRPSAEAPRAFAHSMSFPLLVAIPGFALLSLLGLVIHSLGTPTAAQLPTDAGRAVLSALIASLSFGGAAYLSRRYFGGTGEGQRENTIAYLMAAPLVVAFVCAMYLQAKGDIPVLNPAVAVLKNSSPLEVSSWGALGAVIGFWMAGRATK